MLSAWDPLSVTMAYDKVEFPFVRGSPYITAKVSKIYFNFRKTIFLKELYNIHVVSKGLYTAHVVSKGLYTIYVVLKGLYTVHIVLNGLYTIHDVLKGL